jgi:hypothetical protein
VVSPLLILERERNFFQFNMQSHSAQWPQGVNSRGSTNGRAPASMEDIGWNDEDGK